MVLGIDEKGFNHWCKIGVMKLRYIYPKELVDVAFRRDGVVNIGRKVTNALVVIVGLITVFAFLFEIIIGNWIGAMTMLIWLVLVYVYATQSIGDDDRGVEIGETSIKLLKFFPKWRYKRPLSGVSRIDFKPKISKKLGKVAEKYNVMPIKLYFWEWAGKGTNGKIHLPAIIFVPKDRVSELKHEFSHLKPPEQELVDIVG